MAVPKRRVSSHRQGRRRAGHRIKLPEISVCSFCGSDKRPHYLCPNCGKAGIHKEKESPKETPRANQKAVKSKPRSARKKTRKVQG